MVTVYKFSDTVYCMLLLMMVQNIVYRDYHDTPSCDNYWYIMTKATVHCDIKI